MTSAAARLFPLAIVGLLLLAACSGADDETTGSTSTSAAESTVDATTTTADDRTAEEIAVDRLDVMMFDLGVTDLETTANCVIARLESEGLDLVGADTPELIALFGCDENVMARWLPPTNPALATPDWSCTIGSINDWINDLTIDEAGAFFDASEPPAGFIDVTASRCDISPEDLIAAL